MGVQLNIKSAEARRLAERLARLTHTSLTDAIVDALHQRLVQVETGLNASDDQVRWREAEFYRLIVGSRERWSDGNASVDHVDLPHDERGRPA